MALIKLKMGIKGVVRKETFAAENPCFVAFSLSASDLFPLYTLYPIPQDLSIHV